MIVMVASGMRQTETSVVARLATAQFHSKSQNYSPMKASCSGGLETVRG